MSRHRLRSEVSALDAATAERLLDGHVVPARAPEAHRRLAQVLAAVTARPSDPELRGAPAAAAAFVTAHAAARSTRRTRPLVALAFTGVLFVASTGTAVAATEGALPSPLQAAAHDALGVVGISVPGVTPQHPDPAITATVEGEEPHPSTPEGSPAPSGTVPPVAAVSSPATTATAGAGMTSETTTGGDTAATHRDARNEPAGAVPPDVPAGAPDDRTPGHAPNALPQPPNPRPTPEPRPAPDPRSRSGSPDPEWKSAR